MARWRSRWRFRALRSLRVWLRIRLRIRLRFSISCADLERRLPTHLSLRSHNVATAWFSLLIGSRCLGSQESVNAHWTRLRHPIW